MMPFGKSSQFILQLNCREKGARMKLEVAVQWIGICNYFDNLWIDLDFFKVKNSEHCLIAASPMWGFAAFLGFM